MRDSTYLRRRAEEARVVTRELRGQLADLLIEARFHSNRSAEITSSVQDVVAEAQDSVCRARELIAVSRKIRRAG